MALLRRVELRAEQRREREGPDRLRRPWHWGDSKKRCVALTLVLLTVLLMPQEAWMETEVQHGESPRFSVPISGRYAVTVVGHYTNAAGRAAAGVSKVEWQSDQPAKRRAEMLALRTAFLEWFVEEWVRQGGTRAEAVFQIQAYPF